MAGVIFAFLEFVLRRDVQSCSCWSSDQLDVSSSTRQKMKSSSGLDQRFCPSTYTQNIPCDEFYMRPLHALYKQSFSPETVWEGCCQTALKEKFTQKTHHIFTELSPPYLGPFYWNTLHLVPEQSKTLRRKCVSDLELFSSLHESEWILWLSHHTPASVSPEPESRRTSEPSEPSDVH